MRKHLTLGAVLVSLAMMMGCASKGQTSAFKPQSADTLCVMTFNLKYASNTPPNTWPERRPVMRQAIRSVQPDVIGTQEGVYAQLKDLAADLPEYAWLGLGRDGGSHGEFMAIFYRKDRLEPIEYDHFWLSDTPDVIASSTWGNTCRRMVTWVRFRDRRTGQEFYHANTHLDHQVQVAREKGASLIVQRIEKLNPKLPVVLTGDFNAPQKTNKAYQILTAGGLTDTWFSATQRLGEEITTFHDWKGPNPDDKTHIDWILTRGPITADATQVITYSQNGQYPSDHFPVAAWLRLTPVNP
ncbi:MAG TPA: endonuclease/exonuclease/phosphatase family protein [Tepidisphaeraceae bacterium]|nr:endonuclease/exonuclease/phosphatase family protein [Tepidisphaeraceae bacterium]